mmetsp:Transcript_23850/g.23525  ORF Transcript_23850/g.23525 Transcript_23850/m.23525 type:complete len:136 (+) Transcript_23850:43-450(+)
MVIAFNLTLTNGLYFLLEDGKTRCFKDEVIQNTTIQFKATLLESEAIDTYIDESKGKQGIETTIEYKNGKSEKKAIYKSGEIVTLTAPNDAAGFTLCAGITRGVFKKASEGMDQSLATPSLKIQIEFSNQYQDLE